MSCLMVEVCTHICVFGILCYSLAVLIPLGLGVWVAAANGEEVGL